MPGVRLVSLLKEPIRLRFRPDDPSSEIVVPPSGVELTVRMRSETVCMAEGNMAAIITDIHTGVVGIPDAVDRLVRYVVTVVAFESIQDRKDFVTPAWPLKIRGTGRAYRQLRGHGRAEVSRFFDEAEASGGTGT